MLELRLYMAQRITALIMAPLVIGHIAVMIYAVQGGLSAGEILGRTRKPVMGVVLWQLCRGCLDPWRHWRAHRPVGVGRTSRRRAERRLPGAVRAVAGDGGRAVLAVTMI